MKFFLYCFIIYKRLEDYLVIEFQKMCLLSVLTIFIEIIVNNYEEAFLPCHPFQEKYVLGASVVLGLFLKKQNKKSLTLIAKFQCILHLKCYIFRDVFKCELCHSAVLFKHSRTVCLLVQQAVEVQRVFLKSVRVKKNPINLLNYLVKEVFCFTPALKMRKMKYRDYKSDWNLCYYYRSRVLA